MELGETDHYPLLKVDKVTKPITHTFHCFYGIVNTLNDAGCESMSNLISNLSIQFLKIENLLRLI